MAAAYYLSARIPVPPSGRQSSALRSWSINSLCTINYFEVLISPFVLTSISVHADTYIGTGFVIKILLPEVPFLFSMKKTDVVMVIFRIDAWYSALPPSWLKGKSHFRSSLKTNAKGRLNTFRQSFRIWYWVNLCNWFFSEPPIRFRDFHVQFETTLIQKLIYAKLLSNF